MFSNNNDCSSTVDQKHLEKRTSRYEIFCSLKLRHQQPRLDNQLNVSHHIQHVT